MVTKNATRLLIGIVLLGLISNLYPQDSNLNELQKQGYIVSSSKDTIINVTSLNELHNWFSCRQMELYRKSLAKAADTGSPDLLIPVGIYPIKRQVSLKSRWEMRLSYELPLWQTNVGVGYYRQFGDKWFITPYGTFGGGSQNVEFGQGISKIKTPIEFNFGVGVDAGYNLSRKMALLGGLMYSRWTPKLPSTGILANGSGLSLYAGTKYFLSEKKEISVNLNVGEHFYAGFSNTPPDNFYIQGGFSLYRSASMGKVINHRRPIELGLFACPTLSTANVKALMPFAIREELSIAPFLSWGDKANSEMIYSMAVGLELRLFGKRLEKIVNPYIGAQHHYVEYNRTNSSLIGFVEGNSFYIGTRVKILANIALDANVGRAIWNKNSYKMPDELMLNGGVVIALGKRSKTDELKLHGKVMTKKIDAEDTFPEITPCKPLTEDMLSQYDGEIRTYAYREAETTIFGNLTDLSFIDYFGTAFIIQQSAMMRDKSLQLLDSLMEQRIKQSTKKIVVMLNKEHINIDKLKRAELYLCFTNYDKNRYFGYYYDDNGELQPEYLTDLTLGDAVASRSSLDNIYMGSFDKYTAKLDWVDNFKEESGVITPLAVKTNVLEKFMTYNGMDASNVPLKQQLLGKYEFAYAACDAGMINSLKKFLKDDNLGYAVLAAKDFKKNGLFVEKNDGSLAFDPGDDFVYSNHEKANKFEPPVVLPGTSPVIREAQGGRLVLDKFNECDANLKSEHKQLLDSYRAIFNDAQKIKIIGHSDASLPTEDCLKKFSDGNPAIGEARATSVAQYLQEILKIDAIKIEMSFSQLNPNASKCPTCRQVEIEIIPERKVQQ